MVFFWLLNGIAASCLLNGQFSPPVTRFSDNLARIVEHEVQDASPGLLGRTSRQSVPLTTYLSYNSKAARFPLPDELSCIESALAAKAPREWREKLQLLADYGECLTWHDVTKRECQRLEGTWMVETIETEERVFAAGAEFTKIVFGGECIGFVTFWGQRFHRCTLEEHAPSGALRIGTTAWLGYALMEGSLLRVCLIKNPFDYGISRGWHAFEHDFATTIVALRKQKP